MLRMESRSSDAGCPDGTGNAARISASGFHQRFRKEKSVPEEKKTVRQMDSEDSASSHPDRIMQ